MQYSFYAFTLVTLMSPFVWCADTKIQNIESYLAHFISHDEDYLAAKSNLEATSWSVKASGDVFNSTLSLQPSWSKDSLLTPGVELSQERGRMEANYLQNTPYGLSVALSGRHFFDDPAVAFGGVDRDWTLNLEQSLWQNSFGAATRNLVKNLKAQKVSAQQGLEQARRNACMIGVGNYANYYIQQELNQVVEQRYKNAQTALRIVRRAYREKILRKIDFLNAKSDFQQNEATLLQSSLDLELARNSYHTQAQLAYEPESEKNKDDDSKVQLESPASYFDKVHAPKSYKPKDVVEYLVQKANLETSEYTYKSSKSENRTPVTLGFSKYSRQSLGATGFSSGNFNENLRKGMEVYLKVDLPVFNKTQNGNIQSAYYLWEQSKHQLDKLKWTLEERFNELNVRKKILKLQSGVNASVEKLQLSQLTEAKRLLGAGKIEYVDYTNYRNQYFSTRQQMLNLQMQLWDVRMQLAQFAPNMNGVCPGGA